MTTIKIRPPRTNDPLEIARFYRSVCTMLNALCSVPDDSVAVGGSSDTVLSSVMDNTQGSWANYTLRNTITAANILADAEEVEVTFKAFGVTLGIGEAWIGHASGVNQNFDGNQAQIKFSGSGSAIIASGNSLVSDRITVDIDQATDLIISTYFSVGYDWTCYDLHPASPDSGLRSYYKSGNHAGDTVFSGAGYTAHALYMVEDITGYTGGSVADFVTDFNALLTHLRDTGINDIMDEIKIRPPRTQDPLEIARFWRGVCNMLNEMCDVGDDSTATTVDEVVTDFNDLLQHFRNVDTYDNP